MQDLVALMAIVAIFIVLPALVLGHIREMKRDRLKHEEGSGTAGLQLQQLADRMERRIEALEKILDAEAPGWRNRHG